MFPEFEVCDTTRSTITEVPLSRYSGSPEGVENSSSPPQKKKINAIC